MSPRGSAPPHLQMSNFILDSRSCLVFISSEIHIEIDVQLIDVLGLEARVDDIALSLRLT